MNAKWMLSVFAALLALSLVSSGCVNATRSSAPNQETRPTRHVATAPVFEDQGWLNYRNLDGDSNVVAYHIGEDYIEVEFADGAVYKYTYDSAGAINVERMKDLAEAGDGLNAYIDFNAKYLYEGYVAPVVCDVCLGAGGSVCPVCGGSGNDYCTMCDGTGRDDCWICDGVGWKPCILCDSMGATICVWCRGAGLTECYTCGGSGCDYFGDVCEYWGAGESSPVRSAMDAAANSARTAEQTVRRPVPHARDRERLNASAATARPSTRVRPAVELGQSPVWRAPALAW